MPAKAQSHNWKRPLWIFLIIAIGIFLRTIDLRRPNFHWDEATLATVAQLFVERGYSPWDTLSPCMTTSYLNAIPIALLGTNEVSVRLVSVLTGCLCLVIVYFLAKHWYDRKTAVLGCFILAIMPLHVLNSRFAQLDISQTTFLMAFILCFELGFSERKKAYIIASGVLAGLSFLTKYNSVEIQFLYLAMVFVTERHKPLRAILTHLLVFAGTILILSFGHYYQLALSMGGILLSAGTPSSGSILMNLTRRFVRGNYFYLWVLLDGLSLVLLFILILGCIYFIARIFRRNIVRNDVITVVTLVIYLFIIPFQGRFYARYLVIASPFIAITIARSLVEFRKKFFRWKIIYVGVLVLIIINVGWNYSQVTYQDWTVEREVGKYIRPISGSYDFIYADQGPPLSFYLDSYIPGRALKTIPETREEYLRSKFRTVKISPNGLLVQQEPTRFGRGMVQFRYEPLVYRDSDLTYKLTPQIGRGLLIITSLRDINTHISPMGSGPFDIHVHKRRERYTLSNQMRQLKAFMDRRFLLLKEFYYRHEPVVWVYEVAPSDY